MTTREALRRLVDALPDQDLYAAQRYLEYLRASSVDPVLQAFMQAPVDDEPLTAEDEAALAEAQEAVERGEVEPWEKVRAELLGQG